MSALVIRNSVQERLARGEVAASMTVRLTRGIEIAGLAASAGFDSLYVDLEHSSLSLETTSQICIAALNVGLAPFVRVPQLDMVGRILDGGALGIIVPDVRNAAEAQAAVKAAKYPPLGARGFASALPHFGFRNLAAREFCPALDAATMVIVQFESAAAVDNADAIFAVEGVDMALFGTNDLTADMGIAGDYENPRVRDAYARAIAAARKHGKHVGIGGLGSKPKLTAELVKMGARYVSTGTDLGFLLAAATAQARQVRALET
ncbi:MAG TPA: aldolase/citrate lyase family protein [Xanthobacteraceae bacterium]|nr:aldolase/citrate lyase family protein [Xanthobacteraceae bacterium]